MRGDGVGQSAGIVNAGDRGQDLGRNFLVEFDVHVKLLHHRTAQGFNFTALVAGQRHFGLDRGHIASEMQFTVFNLVDLGALLAFHQHLDGAVRQLEHLQNGGNATHIEHVLDRGLVLGCGFLRHQHDATLGLHGRLQRLDAFGSAHKQRDDHVRKNHHIAQWQHGQIKGGCWQRNLSGHIKPSTLTLT